MALPTGKTRNENGKTSRAPASQTPGEGPPFVAGFPPAGAADLDGVGLERLASSGLVRWREDGAGRRLRRAYGNLKPDMAFHSVGLGRG